MFKKNHCSFIHPQHIHSSVIPRTDFALVVEHVPPFRSETIHYGTLHHAIPPPLTGQVNKLHLLTYGHVLRLNVPCVLDTIKGIFLAFPLNNKGIQAGWDQDTNLYLSVSLLLLWFWLSNCEMAERNIASVAVVIAKVEYIYISSITFACIHSCHIGPALRHSNMFLLGEFNVTLRSSWADTRCRCRTYSCFMLC